MPYMLVRHTVKDYAKWKPIFDEHGSNRKATGSKGGQVFRNHDNPNEVVVLLEVADAAKFREFARSPDLKQTMERAGVIGQPDFLLLDEASRPPA